MRYNKNGILREKNTILLNQRDNYILLSFLYYEEFILCFSPVGST
jgi:hypothetical protein